MPDPVDPYGPRRRSVLPMLMLVLVALLIGMGGMAWLVYRFDSVAKIVKPDIAAPLRAPMHPTAPVMIAAAPPQNAVNAGVDDRIEKIEERVEDIDKRAAAASGEAHRAEGLLVAFATRRAIERGASLGYLEGVLRDRFGGVEPQAVATVISASRKPVTIDQLRDQLHALEPQLSSASENSGWWENIRRELGGLIVVRHASTPSAAPVDRLERAQDDLAAGHVDAALLEVTRLPGRKAAGGWILNARRYVQARTALDRIETAALLRPATTAE